MTFAVLSNFRSLTRQTISRWLVLVALVAAVCMWTGNTVAAEGTGHAVSIETAHGAHAEAEHGLPSAAPEVPVLKFGPLSVTNSMVVTWIVALGLLIFARVATAHMRDVPEGAQNFWEFIVESLRDFLETIIGSHLAKKTFWFFATVFIFILFTNWAGLIPGVGTIGWGHPNEQGGLSHISTPLFRGVSADLNMTLAMAIIFFICWTVWAIQANGVGGFIVHLFGNPARKEMKGLLALMMAIVFIAVGTLEVISILFRPVSLSFRLYGNIFAGENLLEAMAGIVPALAWLIPIPFYFMELLVGLVQALVFMLLTAVFTLLICSHGDEEHAEHH